jgi:hypothetical protein
MLQAVERENPTYGILERAVETQFGWAPPLYLTSSTTLEFEEQRVYFSGAIICQLNCVETPSSTLI